MKEDSSNSTSGNSWSKVFLLIAFASAPVSTCRVNFLSIERGVEATAKFYHDWFITGGTCENIHDSLAGTPLEVLAHRRNLPLMGFPPTAAATFILPVELEVELSFLWEVT